MKLGPFPLWPQWAASEAGRVDFVTLVVLGVCSLLALAVLFSMVFLLLVYRQGREVDRTLPPLTSHRLEIAWIVLPLLLSLGMFWVGAREYFRLYQLPESTDLTVDVVGKQWLWIMRYPNGAKELNRLHVPLGQRVTLRMISEDVIHSLFVPDFRVKHDVLPGRYTYLWFQPTQVGQYRLYCAEFCGTSHASMGGWVEVMTPEDFQRWQTGAQADEPARRGQRLFQQFACQGCHEGSAAAPRLQHLNRDEESLRRSILDPKAEVVPGFEPIMPSYAGRLSEEQILDLIAYLRSRP